MRFRIDHRWRYTLVVLLSLLGMAGHAQSTGLLRYRYITPSDTLIHLDTLSMVPGSFTLVRFNGDTIPMADYHLTTLGSTLHLLPSFRYRTDSILLASYRVFPEKILPVYRDFRLKPEPDVKKQAELSYLYSPLDGEQDGQESFLNFGALRKSGSISRAVSVGNNQDAVLNSSMNLQLSGELSPGINIVAAITDNTLPIQPEGSSQQLREFDKVFIKATGAHWEVVAGDVEVLNGEGQFLRFNRRAQGLLLAADFRTGKDDRWEISSRLSGAIARGKYATNQFNGVEGSQGPYKLTGANNELYVIVLAGSEKVYLDGRLLTRGADNDYVIDYNSAQLTFTPAQPITKDKRIMVMFEYAERNYNRSMLYFQQQARTEGVKLQLQYFSEQDLRSQPMGQEQLLKEHAELLRSIGDNLSDAVVPNIREVPFSNSEVLYRKTDSLVGTTTYSPVFVYSNHPDSAIYRLGFSFVGAGNGNYIQSVSAANGKVFRWVAPSGGVMQGDYEPLILLVTPKKQQMLTFSGEWMVKPALRFFAETAVSGLDLNTYSAKDDRDNTGLALTAGFRHHKTANDSLPWAFSAEGLYRYVQKRFSVVERFKEIEFERDWNSTASATNDEHYGKLHLGLQHRKHFAGSYTFEPLFNGPEYYSIRNSATMQVSAGKWHLAGRGSLMTSQNPYLPVQFLRHQITLERKTRRFVFGLLEEGEENRQHLPGNDTLYGNSFAFQRWQATLANGDSARIQGKIRLGQRVDYLPQIQRFVIGTRADEVWVGLGSNGITDHRVDANIGYRRLTLTQPPTVQEAEESLLGRAEYTHRLWKGLVKGSIFYEFGSGLEYKKEFTYLEVAPGQGVYTWKDYNGDSIKQLDEFEIAVFQDEASYLRIFTPTTEFERVYTMQYNQSLNIDPASVANREKRSGRLLARFSDQGHYRVEQKLGGSNLLAALNPFKGQMEDPALVSLSYSLRNTLYFNRSSAKFGLEYTTARNASKSLLVNGFEQRGQTRHTLRSRWNITRAFILRTEGLLGQHDRASEFFAANDYKIRLRGTSAELQYQPGTRFRVGTKYQFSHKENQFGVTGEQAVLHRATAEFRYSIPMKGSLQTLAEFISINYNSTPGNSVAFEMLEGLRPGDNFTWTIGYQRIMANNMQVNLQYNGRKSPDTPAVHVGTVQVRAFF
jgi:hypothetical protein